MKQGVRFCVLVFFAVLHCVISFGQSSSIRFKHYTVEQGLSQNMIDCMLQDSKGFMWFGTWNGLDRFDGYNFSVFKQSPGSPRAISNNFIYALCEDLNGNIWIGTNNGLNVYVYDQDRFEQYLVEDGKNNVISSPRINALLCDHQGDIWVGTANGLEKFTPDGNRGKIKNSVRFEANKLTSNAILSLCEDKNGHIWIGTANGLNRFDKKSQTITSYLNEPDRINSLSDNTIQSVYCDKKGTLWVGTNNGLNKMESSDGRFKRYFHSPALSESLAHNTIMSITEDVNGELIFGTLGGLSFYRMKSDNFTNYRYKLENVYGLNNEFVNSLSSDKEGNVWVGTEKGGVNVYNVFQNRFDFFENEIGNPNSLNHNTINSILENNEDIWIGTAGGGLNKYHKTNKAFSHYKTNSSVKSSISSDFVTVLKKDKSNNLWVGTWGGGLNKLTNAKESSGSFVRYSLSDGSVGGSENEFVSSVLEDNHGKFWIGTRGGLMFFDPQTGKYEHFRSPGKTPVIRQVGCLEFDAKQNLWVGTISGLYCIHSNSRGIIDPTNSQVDFFHNEPGNSKSIHGDYVISIFRDHKNTMWFGTYGNGLSKYVEPANSRETGEFVSYTEVNGLSDNVVYTILEDNSGNLWLSTDNGLSKFNPEKKQFRNYYVSDGLQSNQFYWSASFKNQEGKMYFGGMKGVNAFFPDSIRDRKFPARTIVTDFKIYNHSVEVGTKYDGRVVLSRSIANTDQIRLSYKSNEFSFEFSALQFNQPDKITYSYKLDGFDKEWTTVTSARRFASYTNLKGADYTFLVKASDNENTLDHEPYSIHITIVPPFWVTWWFKLLLSVIIITASISFYRFRIFTLKRRTRKLEILVKQRTSKIEEQKEELISQAERLKETNVQLEKRKQEIEGQKEQLEMQNEEIGHQRDKLMDLNKKVQVANQQQLNFFTHISHEFRTPLTLIISPLEQMLREIMTDHVLKDKLTLIYKNSQRLLHLINQLMEIRKLETGKMQLKATKSNVVKFTENICASFSSLATQRQIRYSVNAREKTMEMFFDQEVLENILYNLLSNAFKYTPEKGSITVTVSASDGKSLKKDDVAIVDRHLYKHQDIHEFVKIEIADSGIGIAPDQIKDIFRRFYRIHSSVSPKITGTGIGLYLTRELVKSHKALLYVNSSPGKGSTFTLMIPSDENYLMPGEIVTSFQESPSSLANVQVKMLEEQLERATNEPMFRAAEETESGEKISPEKDSTEKPLILVVDDDHDLCNYIAGSLQPAFRVIKAVNGREGIEKALQYSPEVIISDIMMPETDGLELCNRLKTELQTSHIPIILLTARSEAENFIEGMESGADDYISKPFNIRIVEAKVRSLIENRKRLRTLFAGTMIPVPREITTTRSDEVFLQRAIKSVEDNITKVGWSVPEMAAELCISRSLLHKKLTAIVDQSAVDFITSVKLKKSALLMHEGNLNISEVAYSVGFNDPKYFSRCFKKHFGKSPSEYLKSA